MKSTGLTLIGVIVASRLAAAQCPDGTPPPCGPVRQPVPTVAVRQFENHSGDTLDAYLASTLTEDVTAALAASHAVRLVSGATGPGAARYVVTGSVRRTRDAVRIAAQVQQAGSGRIAWTTRLDQPVRALASVPDSLAEGILRAVGVRVPVRAATRGRAANADPALYDLYLRGRYQLRRRSAPGLARAVSLFSEAIARDSSFVLGWVGLARAFERARTWQFPLPGVPRDSLISRLLMAAERANELDSTNAEVWIMRARVSEALDPTSRGPGIRYLRRALAIDSMDADAWQILGLSLEESLDRAGALAALSRAVAVQPGHTEALTFLALHYYWARQYDTAAVWADSVVVVDPTLVVARYAAGTVAIERGRRSEAEAQLQACNRLATSADVQCLTGLARLAARTGDPAAARDYLAQALARTDSISPSVHGAVYLACAYATLGDPDRALSWLTRYSPRRDMHFQMHMRYEPALDALRSDPRFQALRTETR